MESEHIKAAANKVGGKVKEETGEALDNKEMELKGKLQQAKAKMQDAIGDAKDRAENDS